MGSNKMEPSTTIDDNNFFATQPRERCHTWPMPQFPPISTHSSPYHSPLSSGYPSTSSINQGPLPSISLFCGSPLMSLPQTSQPYYFHQQYQPPQYAMNKNFMGYNLLNYHPQHSFSSTNGSSFNINDSNNNLTNLSPPRSLNSDDTTNAAAQIDSSTYDHQQPGSSRANSPSASPAPQSNGDGNGKPKRKRIRKKDPNHIAQKKPNPWGEESYSDLIMKALESSPTGRLKLNEVYQWFIDNVKFFGERCGSEDAAGWKNSIRHNLSLHSRFMRIQNEGAGKSSWWVINPEAKPGRNPRRRAQTMESTTKAKIERSRRGARKRVELGALRSGNSSAIGSTASILSHDIFNDQDDPLNSNFDTFRGRTHSNVSTIGNNIRISPTAMVDRFEEFDFPPWAADQQRSSNPEVNEIMGRTGDIRLDNTSDFKTDFRGTALTDTNTLLGDFPGPKLEFDDPPPPYQELNQIRPPMQMQPQMMRNFNPQQQHRLPHMQPPMRMTTQQQNGYYVYNNGSMMPPPPQNQSWQPTTLDYAPNAMALGGVGHHQHNPSLFETTHQTNNGQLPMDLEGLSLPDTMEFGSDVETILRHELSQTHDQQIHFDL